METDLALYNSDESLYFIRDKDSNRVKFTLDKYLEVNPANCRFYLYTKFWEHNQPIRSWKEPVQKQPSRRKGPPPVMESKESHNFDPDQYFSEGVFPSTSTPLIGTSQERSDLKEEQDMEYQRSMEAEQNETRGIKGSCSRS